MFIVNKAHRFYVGVEVTGNLISHEVSRHMTCRASTDKPEESTKTKTTLGTIYFFVIQSITTKKVLEIISNVSQETTVNFKVLYQAVRSLMVKIDCELDRTWDHLEDKPWTCV